MGHGGKSEPELELGSELVLEMVGTVLVLVPELVPGPGPMIGPEAVLGLEMEGETEQGNKYSALHP